MNKRIHSKLQKKSNSQRTQEIFTILNQHNITPLNPSYYNGWHTNNSGANSIVYFYIEENLQWKCGIHLCKDNQYKIFAECIDCIDKFRPSYACISTDNVGECIDQIQDVINHPKWHYIQFYDERFQLYKEGN